MIEGKTMLAGDLEQAEELDAVYLALMHKLAAESAMSGNTKY
jgi:hypothetical protein